MEIQSLHLVVAEQDFNDLAASLLPPDEPVKNLRVRIAPEGIFVTGKYPMLVGSVPFETLWEPGVKEGKATAHLASFKASGVPATLFQGMVIRALEDAMESQQWFSAEGETVCVDVEKMLAAHGVKVRANLKAIRCLAGSLEVECGGS